MFINLAPIKSPLNHHEITMKPPPRSVEARPSAASVRPGKPTEMGI
jgi:hypothetical protein